MLREERERRKKLRPNKRARNDFFLVSGANFFFHFFFSAACSVFSFSLLHSSEKKLEGGATTFSFAAAVSEPKQTQWANARDDLFASAHCVALTVCVCWRSFELKSGESFEKERERDKKLAHD